MTLLISGAVHLNAFVVDLRMPKLNCLLSSISNFEFNLNIDTSLLLQFRVLVSAPTSLDLLYLSKKQNDFRSLEILPISMKPCHEPKVFTDEKQVSLATLKNGLSDCRPELAVSKPYRKGSETSNKNEKGNSAAETGLKLV